MASAAFEAAVDTDAADAVEAPPMMPGKKGARKRKPLKPKASASSAAAQPSPSPIKPLPSSGKENGAGPSPANKGKRISAEKHKASLAEELLDLQKMLGEMKLEKEKAEVMLKEKDAMLERKEMELQQRGEAQEKLQKELKKLQKLKEFKPTLTIPCTQSQAGVAEQREKKGKKKDGHEVKRPCPPYSLWCKDQWNEVKKEKPELDFKEISNILGAKWKTLSPEEKKPYEEKYQAEKERYLQIVGKEKREKEAMKLFEEEQKQKTAMELLEQYVQFIQEVEKEDKKVRKQKDPLKPKRPMSAYFIFSNGRRAALLVHNKNIVEIAKIAGEEWKNMTEAKRAPYEKIANEQREEYLRQMELYKQQKEEEVLTRKREEEELMKVQKQEALQLLKKKEKTDNIIKKTKEKKKKEKEGKIVDPNKPKKPATSFLLFSNEMRKQLMQQKPPGTNNATLSAIISVQWKELSEEEKRTWNDKAAQAMANYKKEMEEYYKSSSAGNGGEAMT